MASSLTYLGCSLVVTGLVCGESARGLVDWQEVRVCRSRRRAFAAGLLRIQLTLAVSVVLFGLARRRSSAQQLGVPGQLG